MPDNKPELAACPFCGGEAQLVSNYRMSVVCLDCDHSIENPHPAIQCMFCGGIMMGTAEHWNRRYVCDDKHGKPVFAGDRAKSSDCEGKVDRLGGIRIESDDGHLHHVWPSEIELIQESEDDNE